MNIATGKLEAPVVKTASGLMEYLAEAGTSLLKNKGALSGLMPVESYALSAGLGAGTQQATKRLLDSKLRNYPKLLKALELGAAGTVGGGAGLVGALAAPLSPAIARTTGLPAARNIAELTAMGTGAELMASPFLAAAVKGGAEPSALNTLGKMFGGGALAFGGRVARDSRQLNTARRMMAAGLYPKNLPKPDFTTSLKDLAKMRYESLGIPEGAILGTAGAGLMAAGSPVLGGAALLAAPMRNTAISNYVGTVAKELSAAKKSKDTLDALYKKSSYSPRSNIKLAAPVYRTNPDYILDAPTYEKLGSWQSKLLTGAGALGGALMSTVGGGAVLGLGAGKAVHSLGRGGIKGFQQGYQAARGSAPGMKGFFQGVVGGLKGGTTGAVKDLAESSVRGVENVSRGLGYAREQGAKLFTGTGERAGAKASERAQRIAGSGGGAAQSEAGLVRELGGPTAPTATTSTPVAPVQTTATGPRNPVRRVIEDAYNRGRQQVRSSDRYRAQTEEGRAAYEQLGRGEQPAVEAAQRIEAGGAQAQAQRATEYTKAPVAPPQPVQNPINIPNAMGGNLEVTKFRPKVLDNVSKMTEAEAAAEYARLQTQAATTPLKGAELETFKVLDNYAVGNPAGGKMIDAPSFLNGQAEIVRAAGESKAYADANKAYRAGQRQVKKYEANPLAPKLKDSPLTAPVAEQAAVGAEQTFAIPRITPRIQGAGADASAAQEVMRARGLNPELGEALQVVEGPGGTKNFVTRSADQARNQAMKQSGLDVAANENAAAIEALATDAGAFSTSGIVAGEEALVQQSLRELSTSSAEFTPQKLLEVMKARNGGTNPATTEQVLADLLGKTTSGQAAVKTQKNLANRFAEYESRLNTNLTDSLRNTIDSQRDTLSKTVSDFTGRKKGLIPGRRTNVYNQAEQTLATDIEALTQQRIKSLESGTLKDRQQAAELGRIVNDVFRGKNVEELQKLREALIKGKVEVSTTGTTSRLSKYLNTPAREKAIQFTESQNKALKEVFTTSGRGKGNVTEELGKVYSTEAIASPNSSQGQELLKHLNESATGQANKDLGGQLLNMGQQGGAGSTAAEKLLVRGESNISNFTMAELNAVGQAKGAVPPPPSYTGVANIPGRAPAGTAPAQFNAQAQQRMEQVFSPASNASVGENLKALEQEIVQLEKGLTSATKSGRQGAIELAEYNLNIAKEARAQAKNHLSTLQTGIQNEVKMVQEARQLTSTAIKEDVKFTGLKLQNDASKVEIPRSINLDAVRERAANLTYGPEGQVVVNKARSNEIVALFENVTKNNKAIDQAAVAQRLINEGLVSVEELAVMGGDLPQALATQIAARGGKGPGALGTGLVLAGTGGLVAAGARKRSGTATKAKTKAQRMQPQGSWGLSPLHAPVVYRKKTAALAAPVKPPKMENPKYPKPKDVQPGFSAYTSTPDSLNEASRRMGASSMLSAPVSY